MQTTNEQPSLREIQLTQYEMVRLCKQICEKHGLTYFLTYGTLLGAVRHGGYIPWDDDADIAMPVGDYLRFREIFLSEAPEGYFLEDSGTEYCCPFPWIKIRKDNTASMPVEYKRLPAHWGICIDIFPLYYASRDESDQRYIHFLGKIATTASEILYTKFEKSAPLQKRVVAFLPVWLHRLFYVTAKKRLLARRDGTMFFDGWDFIEKSYFTDPPVQMKFEDEMFAVPAGWDEYLTLDYGDYMTLPPENERGGHADSIGRIIWSTTKSYKEFL